jgi:hypothetical protein
MMFVSRAQPAHQGVHGLVILGGQNPGGARSTYNDYGTLRDRLCRHCGCLVAWLTPGAGGAGLDTVRHARCSKCNDTGEAEADK